MSEASKFPLTLPGGQLMPHMSARRRHEICDTVFEMLGGVERLHTEANRNNESYWEFMKMWQKGLPRAAATEPTSNNEALEEMLKRLDASDRAQVINGTSSRVHDDVVDVPEEDS
jgi:Ser/Thr protein kinase RdoA (MazF antagonist)